MSENNGFRSLDDEIIRMREEATLKDGSEELIWKGAFAIPVAMTTGILTNDALTGRPSPQTTETTPAAQTAENPHQPSSNGEGAASIAAGLTAGLLVYAGMTKLFNWRYKKATAPK